MCECNYWSRARQCSNSFFLHVIRTIILWQSAHNYNFLTSSLKSSSKSASACLRRNNIKILSCYYHNYFTYFTPCPVLLIHMNNASMSTSRMTTSIIAIGIVDASNIVWLPAKISNWIALSKWEWHAHCLFVYIQNNLNLKLEGINFSI